MNDNGMTPEEIAKVNWLKVGPRLFEAMRAALNDESFLLLSEDTQNQLQEAEVEMMAYLAPDESA